MTLTPRLSKNERHTVHRYFTVTWSDAELTSVTLTPEFGADCTLECSFCSGFGSTHTLRSVTPALVKKITAELDDIVAGASSSVIGLQSHDILQYRGLIELLDVIGAHEKIARLWTPGVRLADRELCRQLLDRRLELNITFLSSNAETYTRMTGNSEARDLLCKGLENVKELGLPANVSLVITDENDHELAETISFLHRTYAIDRLSIRLFYPTLPPRALDRLFKRKHFRRFPDYTVVNQQLRSLESNGAIERVGLDLFDLPLCQLDPYLLQTKRVVVEDIFFNYTRVKRPVEPCLDCPAWKQCCGGIDTTHVRQQTIRWLPEAERDQLLEGLERSRERQGSPAAPDEQG